MLNALIVDDEPFIRKGILNKIKWSQFGIKTPAEASDGIEAMEYLKSNQVDIVFTDIKMPEMDGIRLVEEARKQFGEIHKFVIISGYGEFEYARQAMKFGVTDFLLKPVKETELKEIVTFNIAAILRERQKNEYKKILEVSNLLNDEQKKLFKVYLQEGKKECIIKLIDEIFSKVKQSVSRNSNAVVHDLCLEYFMLLSSLFGEDDKYTKTILGEKYEVIEEIINQKSIDDILIYVKEQSNKVFDSLFKDRKVTGEEIVREVKSYIDSHYYEDITLNTISNKFFIHPNYFCRIFKDIIGQNFSDYLTGIRIKKAQELLLSSDLMLKDISEMVGYEDPRYFSQVFKKYCGITPSEYKTARM
ncbi:MAG: response regulator transcription factor [Acetivibrionales bacterium]